jgi:hypothetical protein
MSQNIIKFVMGFQKEKIESLSSTFFTRLYEAFKLIEERLGILENNVGNPSISRLAKHAITHQRALTSDEEKAGGGTDLIYIDNLGPASDNTRLNVSISQHGLTPKLSNSGTTFFSGLGTYLTPDHGSLGGLTDNDHLQYKMKHGFERDISGNHLITITYDKTTRKITITPTGSTFSFWINGVKFTKTGAQVSGAHGTTTGNYFYYYDSSGVLGVSGSAWNITDRTLTPVALVYWDNNITDGECFFEAHGAERNLELHKYLHYARGTSWVSGATLSGHTIGTDSDAAVTFAISSGVIADEDIFYTLTGISDGGPYTVFYRTGANGDWVWDKTPTLPFKYGTHPQFNAISAGSWTLIDTNNLDFINYYLLGIPSVTVATQYVLVPGQVQYGSLNEALQNETFANLSVGTVPWLEAALIYKLTFEARTAYSGTAKTKLAAVTYIAQVSLAR